MTSTRLARECLAALLSASCAIRYSAVSTSEREAIVEQPRRVQLRGDAGALGPLLDVVGERRPQPEIVERGRPELPHELIDVAIEPFGDLGERGDVVRQVGALAARVPEQRDAQAERRQLLAELIVHVARDAPPLVFLDEDEVRQQLGARTLGLPLPAFGQIEMGADDPDHRPARLAADRKAARQDWT